MNHQSNRPANFEDLSGRRFDKLVVVCESGMCGPHVQWKCQCDCGNTHLASTGRLKAGQVRSCGCLRRRKGSANPKWKGGRQINPQGYVLITTHPNGGRRKRVFEHVLIMEQILGRKLYDDESIHHKNGIRGDNAPSNLELKPSSHGRGQSIPDLISWAKEILRRYDQPA